jgi:hypothetical protein
MVQVLTNSKILPDKGFFLNICVNNNRLMVVSPEYNAENIKFINGHM